MKVTSEVIKNDNTIYAFPYMICGILYQKKSQDSLRVYLCVEDSPVNDSKFKGILLHSSNSDCEKFKVTTISKNNLWIFGDSLLIRNSS